MSTLDQIKGANLEDEFSGCLMNFLVKGDDEATKKSLVEAVDKHGLKSPKLMKLIGDLQRASKLKAGLYKELVALNTKLSNGGSPEPAPEEVSEEVKAESTEADPADSGDSPSEDDDEVKFSEKQEQKIKERMQKAEQKMREQLLKKEQKIRERLGMKAEKRAQRLGMKVEEAQEVQEKKEELAKLREEYKLMRERMKSLRDDIRGLRPRRSKMSDEERAFKVWSRKVSRLTARVAKWEAADDEKSAEKLADAQEKLVEAESELEKASKAFEEWKATQPEVTEPTE